MTRNCTFRAVALLIVAVHGVVSTAGEADSSVRRYQSGLLTKADFAAEAPDKLPERGGVIIHAMVETEVRFQHKWKYRRRGRKVQATLTEIDFYAVVHPAESWTTRADDEALLDHAQGHFDLAAIYAEKMERQFAPLIAEGQVQGTGRDRESAQAALAKAIQEQCSDLLGQLYEEHVTFDTTTAGGSSSRFEAQQRERQRTMMRELGIEPPTK